MNLADAKQGTKIEYIGDSLGFGGTYTMIPAESTYYEASYCPEHERGKQMIVEFESDGKPIFLLVENLNPKEWRVVV